MLNDFLLKQKLTAFLKEDLEFGDASLAPLPDHVIEGTFLPRQMELSAVCRLSMPSMTF